MKKITILQRTLILLLCAILYTGQAAFSDTMIGKAAADPEKEDNANSFRYKDGLPIEGSSYPLPFLRASTGSSAAWTKVDGAFVNSNLDPIPGATQKGIDVSHHQGKIDWNKVSNSDVDFAIIRCGYGQDYESQDDAYWEFNADACTEYGIPFGTYLYSYATTVEKAIGEANHVLRLIKGYDLQYPVYFDMEDASQASLSTSALGKIADAFCTTIEDAGYEAAVYANTSWHTTKLTHSAFDQRDRWVAQYNSSCKYTGEYNLWQCTSSGRVDGINGDMDINFLIGDKPAAEVTKIKLNTSTLSLPVGESQNITATISPKNAYDKSISLTSSNPSVATVKNGKITALSEGSATITALANDGCGANAALTVNVGSDTSGNNGMDASDNPKEEGGKDNPPDNSGSNGENNDSSSASGDDKKEPEKLILSKKNLTLKDGGTVALKVDLEPDNSNSNVTFSSSKASIASVNSAGKITAKAPGKAVITVKAGSLKASCNVTVTPKTVSGLSFRSASANAITLNWKKVPGASGYTIYYYNTKTKKNTALKSLSSGTLSYTVKKINGTSLMAGSSYTFKVAAYKTISGKKTYGSKKSIKAVTKPGNTVLKALTRSSSSKIKITWSKASSATGYVIYVSEKKNSGYKAVKTIDKKSTTSYTASGLKKGKTYYFKIATYKKTGGKTVYGGYSNTRSLKLN